MLQVVRGWSDEGVRDLHPRHPVRASRVSYQQLDAGGHGGDKHHPSGRQDEGLQQDTGEHPGSVQGLESLEKP